MSENRTLGQVGFDAYGDRAGWKAYNDAPMPRWDDNLRPDIKDKWEVAAAAIAKKAVEDFIAHACFQCRNPDSDGICSCGRAEDVGKNG